MACGCRRPRSTSSPRPTAGPRHRLGWAAGRRGFLAWGGRGAASQHVVTATDGRATPPARLVGWTSRFLGMVMPGDDIEFRVDRVGIDRGAEIIEVTAKVDNELVVS